MMRTLPLQFLKFMQNQIDLLQQQFSQAEKEKDNLKAALAKRQSELDAVNKKSFQQTKELDEARKQIAQLTKQSQALRATSAPGNAKVQSNPLRADIKSDILAQQQPTLIDSQMNASSNPQSQQTILFQQNREPTPKPVDIDVLAQQQQQIDVLRQDLQNRDQQIQIKDEQLTELQQITNQFELKVTAKEQEINQLNFEIKALRNTEQSQSEQLNQYEQMQREMTEIREINTEQAQKIVKMTTETHNLKQQVQQLQREVTAKNVTLRAMENSYDELNIQYETLRQNQSTEIQQVLKEVQLAKLQNMQASDSVRDATPLPKNTEQEQKLLEYEQQIQGLSELKTNNEAKIDELRTQINALQEKLDTQTKENQKLRNDDQTTEFDLRFSQLKKKYDENIAEKQRCALDSRSIKDSVSQMVQSMQPPDSINTKLIGLKTRILRLEPLVNDKLVSISSLNDRINDKNIQIQQLLKQKIEELEKNKTLQDQISSAQNANLNQKQIEFVQSEKERVERENQVIKAKLQTYEKLHADSQKLIQDLQKQKDLVTDEKEKLLIQSENSNQQIANLSAELQKLQGQKQGGETNEQMTNLLSENNQIKHDLESIKEQFEICDFKLKQVKQENVENKLKIGELQKQIADNETQIENQKKQNKEYVTDIQKANISETQQLNRKLQEQQQQVFNLQAQAELQSKQIEEGKNSMQQISKEKQELQYNIREQKDQYENEIQRLEAQSNEKSKQINELSIEVGKYQAQIARLDSSKSQLQQDKDTNTSNLQNKLMYEQQQKQHFQNKSQELQLQLDTLKQQQAKDKQYLADLENERQQNAQKEQTISQLQTKVSTITKQFNLDVQNKEKQLQAMAIENSKQTSQINEFKQIVQELGKKKQEKSESEREQQLQQEYAQIQQENVQMIEEFKNELAVLQQQNQALSEQNEAKIVEIDQINYLLKDLKNENSQLTKNIALLQQRNEILDANLKEQRQVEVKPENQRNLQVQVDFYKNQLEIKNSQNCEKDNQIFQLQQEIDEMKINKPNELVQSLKIKVQNLLSEIESKDLTHHLEMDESKKEIKVKCDQIAKLQQEIQLAKAQISQKQVDSKQTKASDDQNYALLNQITQLKEQLSITEAERNQLLEQLSLIPKSEEPNAIIQELQQQVVSYQSDLLAKDEKHNQALNERQTAMKQQQDTILQLQQEISKHKKELVSAQQNQKQGEAVPQLQQKVQDLQLENQKLKQLSTKQSPGNQVQTCSSCSKIKRECEEQINILKQQILSQQMVCHQQVNQSSPHAKCEQCEKYLVQIDKLIQSSKSIDQISNQITEIKQLIISSHLPNTQETQQAFKNLMDKINEIRFEQQSVQDSVQMQVVQSESLGSTLTLSQPKVEQADQNQKQRSQSESTAKKMRTSGDQGKSGAVQTSQSVGKDQSVQKSQQQVNQRIQTSAAAQLQSTAIQTSKKDSTMDESIKSYKSSSLPPHSQQAQQPSQFIENQIQTQDLVQSQQDQLQLQSVIQNQVNKSMQASQFTTEQINFIQLQIQNEQLRDDLDRIKLNNAAVQEATYLRNAINQVENDLKNTVQKLDQYKNEAWNLQEVVQKMKLEREEINSKLSNQLQLQDKIDQQQKVIEDLNDQLQHLRSTFKEIQMLIRTHLGDQKNSQQLVDQVAQLLQLKHKNVDLEQEMQKMKLQFSESEAQRREMRKRARTERDQRLQIELELEKKGQMIAKQEDKIVKMREDLQQIRQYATEYTQKVQEELDRKSKNK